MWVADYERIINYDWPNNALVKRKRQIPEIPKNHSFSGEKVWMLKSSYISKIIYNTNKISKYLNSKGVERDKIYLCVEKSD